MINLENPNTASGEKTGADGTSEANSGENVTTSSQATRNTGFGPTEQCRPVYPLRWWSAGNGRIPCTKTPWYVFRWERNHLMSAPANKDTHPAIKLAFFVSCQ